MGRRRQRAVPVPFMQFQVHGGCVGLSIYLLQTPFPHLESGVSFASCSSRLPCPDGHCLAYGPAYFLAVAEMTRVAHVLQHQDHLRCQIWMPFVASRGREGFFDFVHVTRGFGGRFHILPGLAGFSRAFISVEFLVKISLQSVIFTIFVTMPSSYGTIPYPSGQP